MSQPSTNPKARTPGGGQTERRSYNLGFALALLLTAIAFALAHWHWLPRAQALLVIGACALAQIVVHFRYFLHIDLSASRREDLQLILFSALIIALMVGGGLWIMVSLQGRMM